MSHNSYQNQLSHEARLIVQGRQAYVADVVALVSRLKAWLGLPV